jgi:hypothetical protein
LCCVKPIADSLIASAGSLIKWNVSFVGCFVCVSVAILNDCGDAGYSNRGKINEVFNTFFKELQTFKGVYKKEDIGNRIGLTLNL